MSGESLSVAHNCARVSVVTVVYNAAESIRETMDSVLGQDYPNIEYIVIDGGSTDGTLDLIESNRHRLAYISSGPDAGIYDAMNKGLVIATGQWINFMNAGDRFVDSRVVSTMMTQATDDDVVLFGAVEIRYPNFKRTQRPGNLRRLWTGMQFSHQAAFTRLSYHQTHPFELRYRITADLHFFFNAYTQGKLFRELQFVVASVNTGGLSEANPVRTLLESSNALCGDRIRPLIKAYFYGRTIDALLRKFLKSILPQSIVKWITLNKSA